MLLACAHAPETRAQFDEWGRWENGITEAWWLDPGEFTNEDAFGAATIWKRAGEETAGAQGGPWVGDYFRGSETHGTYLRWAPRAGFVIAHVNKCEARVMGLVYGRVEVTPTVVRFFPELDKVPAGSHHGGGDHGAKRHAEPRAVIRFVPVEWRGQRLLVGEEEMGGLGDYAAGLGEYNDTGMLMFLGYDPFFLRSHGAAGWEGVGAPVVPPGYERFLKRPIRASVTAVGGRQVRRGYTVEGANRSVTYERASVTYVTINAGTEQGVKEKMVLRVVRPDEGEEVFVVRARRRSSTAIVVRDLDERGREIYYDSSRERRHAKVAAGWRLTTSLF